MKWKKFGNSMPPAPKDGTPIGVMRQSFMWPSVAYWSPVFQQWLTMIVEIQEDGKFKGTMHPVPEDDIIRWAPLPRFGDIEG